MADWGGSDGMGWRGQQGPRGPPIGPSQLVRSRRGYLDGVTAANRRVGVKLPVAGATRAHASGTSVHFWLFTALTRKQRGLATASALTRSFVFDFQVIMSNPQVSFPPCDTKPFTKK